MSFENRVEEFLTENNIVLTYKTIHRGCSTSFLKRKISFKFNNIKLCYEERRNEKYCCKIFVKDLILIQLTEDDINNVESMDSVYKFLFERLV